MERIHTKKNYKNKLISLSDIIQTRDKITKTYKGLTPANQKPYLLSLLNSDLNTKERSIKARLEQALASLLLVRLGHVGDYKSGLKYLKTLETFLNKYSEENSEIKALVRDLYLIYGNFCVEFSKYSLALDYYRLALYHEKNTMRRIRVELNMARALTWNGELAQAIQILNNINEDVKQDKMLDVYRYMLKARIFAILGDINESSRVLKSMESLFPLTPRQEVEYQFLKLLSSLNYQRAEDIVLQYQQFLTNQSSLFSEKDLEFYQTEYDILRAFTARHLIKNKKVFKNELLKRVKRNDFHSFKNLIHLATSEDNNKLSFEREWNIISKLAAENHYHLFHILSLFFLQKHLRDKNYNDAVRILQNLKIYFLKLFRGFSTTDKEKIFSEKTNTLARSVDTMRERLKYHLEKEEREVGLFFNI